MKEFLIQIKDGIYNVLEEILFLLAFIIFNIAMFKVNEVAGLITLSITLFIIGSFVTFIKTKTNSKGGVRR